MNNFTEDEIRCLKKLIYKVRQEEILELYNKSTKPRNECTREFYNTFLDDEEIEDESDSEIEILPSEEKNNIINLT